MTDTDKQSQWKEMNVSVSSAVSIQKDRWSIQEINCIELNDL
jgi:hypothetical protein